jgi:hypothetical protein
MVIYYSPLLLGLHRSSTWDLRQRIIDGQRPSMNVEEIKAEHAPFLELAQKVGGSPQLQKGGSGGRHPNGLPITKDGLLSSP